MKNKMFIGLMGISSDGTMYTPNGKKLFRLPLKLASIIQQIQHRISRLTH